MASENDTGSVELPVTAPGIDAAQQKFERLGQVIQTLIRQSEQLTSRLAVKVSPSSGVTGTVQSKEILSTTRELGRLHSAIRTVEKELSVLGDSWSRAFDSGPLKDFQLAQKTLVSNALSGTYTKQSDAIRENLRLEQARLAAAAKVGAAYTEQQAKVRTLRAELEKTLAAEKSAGETSAAERQYQSMMNRLNYKGGAGLFEIQARLMLNYSLINGFVSTLGSAKDFVIDFEAELKNMQAISGSTSLEMSGLATAFLSVANSAKFSAIDVAKAGTVMAQAGLSPSQIEESIQGVVRLATATGTDLKTSVDIATSAMSIFNLRASEMNNVADLVSAALNVSKLDAEKFSLGLQYAGNTAAVLGISLNDVTAALSLMANTGIRSGSTLGTGLQQVLKELSAPSDKLLATFRALGLSVTDVDVRSQGLFGALKNLRDAGYTVTQALEVMDVRAARALAAMFNQLDKADDMRRAISLSGDAAAAAATQMESLSAKWQKFQNVSGSLAASSSEPLVEGFKAILSGATSAMGGLKEFNGLLSISTTAAASLAAASIGVLLTKMAANLFAPSINAVKSLGAAFTAATSASGGLSAALTVLGKANPVILGLTAAVTVGTLVWEKYSAQQRKAREESEALQASFNTEKGRYDDLQTGLSSLNDEISRLYTQYGRLSQSGTDLSPIISELNSRFRNLGLHISGAVDNVDTLIERLDTLRQQQLGSIFSSLTIQSAQLGTLASQATRGLGDLNPGYVTSLFQNDEALNRAGFRTSRGLGARLGQRQYPQSYGSDSQAAAGGEIIQAIRLLDKGIGSDRDKTLEEFSNQIRRLNDAGVALASDDPLRLALDRVVEELSSWSKKIDSTTGLEAQKSLVERSREEVEFQRSSPAYAAFQTLAREAVAQFSSIRNSYTRNALGRDVTDDDRQKMVSELQSAASGYASRRDSLKAQYASSADLLVSTNAFSSVEGPLRDAEAEIKQLQESLNKTRKEAAQKALEVLKADQDLLKTKVENALKIAKDSNASPEEARKAAEDFAELWPQLIEAQRAVAQRESDTLKSDAAGKSAVLEKSLLEIDAQARQYQYEQNDLAQTLSRLSADHKAYMTGLKRQLEEAETAYKQAQLSASLPLSAAQTNLSRIKGTYGTDWDAHTAYAEQERAITNEIEPQYYAALVEAIDNQLRAFTNIVIGVNERILSAQAELDQVQKASNGSADSQTKIGTAQKRVEELTKEQAEIDGKIADLSRSRLDATKQVAEAYANRTPTTVGGALSSGYNSWALSSGIDKSYTEWLQTELPSALNASSNAFATFASTVASRSATVGSAIRTMATSILQSMLQITTNRLAASMLGYALSAFSTAATSSAGYSASAGDGYDSLATVNYNGGGSVRRAALGYSGSISTRDSVNIKARPGEYVLRNAAVDAIGVDNLDAINALGNRTISQSDTSRLSDKNEAAQQTVNVWVVTPDQQPSGLSANDVVVTVAQDLLTGGTLKKLVKSVANGTG